MIGIGKTLQLVGLIWLPVLSLTMAAAPVRAQSTPSSFTTYTRYNALRQVTGTIASDPDGAGPLHHAAVRNTYDMAGRLIRVEKGELTVWQSEAVAPANWTGFQVFSRVDTVYDALDRKLSETVSAGGVTEARTDYHYDLAGQLDCTAVRMNKAVFASLGVDACTLGPQGAEGPDRITRNTYDAAGQLLKVTKAYGTADRADDATYTYSLNGKQTSVTDANGNKAALTYDGFDRQIGWYFPDKTTVGQVSTTDYESYGYDANGNRTSWRKRDGRVFTFTYDTLNRQTAKIVPDGCAPIQAGPCPQAAATRDVYFSYDLRGLQTAARYDSASGADAVTNSYDGFGRLASSTTAMAGFVRSFSYDYDADGNRLAIHHPDGEAFHFSYDGLNRNVYTWATDYSALGVRKYDARGSLTSRLNNFDVIGRDGIGRVTGIAHTVYGAQVTSTFSYNPASQITTRTRDNDAYAWTGAVNVDRDYATNGLNQYVSAGPASFSYDANGNLVGDGTSAYGYDSENRLVSASNGTSLSYDPLGRLWRVSSPTTDTRFLYDGDQLTIEYGASGQVLRRYAHGPDDDDPIGWYEGAAVTPANARRLFADHQGSIVAISNWDFWTFGINAYDEYGIPKPGSDAFTGTGNVGRFQYTGQAWLPELGMYHYKARIYSPTLGRFLQTDPIGYKDQINLYVYVGNDPVNGTDPTGEEIKVGSTVEKREDGTTVTTIDIHLTGALNLDGASLPAGLSLTQAAENLEKTIETDFSKTYTDSKGNVVNYVTRADIVAGPATGSQHNFTIVTNGDKRIGDAAGIAPGFDTTRQVYINSAVFTRSGQFERTVAHEFGHKGGLRHMFGPSRNLMTQSRYSNSHHVNRAQLQSIWRNPLFR